MPQEPAFLQPKPLDPLPLLEMAAYVDRRHWVATKAYCEPAFDFWRGPPIPGFRMMVVYDVEK